MKFSKPNKKHISQFITVSAIVAMICFVSSMQSIDGRLTIFADTLMVISLVLLCIGLFNMSRLSGDYDAITFFMSRGGRFATKNKEAMDFQEFTDMEQEQRDGQANIPLWVGICGILISIYLTYFVIR